MKDSDKAVTVTVGRESDMDMLICSDCAQAHANGDLSGIHDAAREREVRDGLARYPWLIVGDPYGFSWSSCDSCRSGLGGDRYEAAQGLRDGAA